VLYRDFLFRIVDLELVSARGDVQNLLVQFTALLAAFSLMVTVLYVPRYVYSTLAPAQLQIAAWGDEEFLIATALAVAGLFAILAWNTALPSRRASRG